MKRPRGEGPTQFDATNEALFHLIRSAGRAYALAEQAFATFVPAVLRLRLEELLAENARMSRLARAELAVLEARMRDAENSSAGPS